MRSSAGRATGNSDFRPPVEGRLFFVFAGYSRGSEMMYVYVWIGVLGCVDVRGRQG